MLIGLTHAVSPDIAGCEVTYIERDPVDYERAARQHAEYCGLLKRRGLRVETLSESADCPDSCFVEDTAIVFDEVAIIASMGAPSRRAERGAVQKFLARHRPLAFIELPATIDGGDVVKAGRNVFVGLSTRTNALAVSEMERILAPLGYRVRAVKIGSSLHLTTACSALDDETLLVNPRWVDLEPFKGLKVLTVSEDEPWSANTLRLSDAVCIEAGAPRTQQLVRGLGLEVEVIDISELRKAEGSLTCLSIIFEGLPA